MPKGSATWKAVFWVRAMLAFLGLNGRRLDAPDDDLTALVLGVAEGRVTKADVAVFVRRHTVRRKR